MNDFKFRVVLLFSLLVLAVGCKEETTQKNTSDSGVDTKAEPDSKSDTSTDTDAGTDTHPDYAYPIDTIETNWFPCSFIDGEDDGLGECSSTPMPLFWNNPDGRTIEIYAKRRLANGSSEGQIWFLHGGPGASGVEGLPPLLDRIQSLYPELDVYTIDHRGVGDSDKLSCAGLEDPYNQNLSECLSDLDEQYGDDLHAYSVSDSAIDLAAYIEATRQEGQNVFVWGGSYGTYIGHRYVQIFPNQANGIILEGISPADSTFIGYEDEFDRAGKSLLEVCGKDAYCSDRLGDNPIDVVKDVFNKVLTQSHCDGMHDYQYYLPNAIAYLLYYHPFHNAIPAIVHRLDRCEPGDQQALHNLLGMLFGPDAGFMDLGDGYSDVLYKNVVYSEMWEHPDYPDEETIMDYFWTVKSNAVFRVGGGEEMYREWEVWPKYNDELYDNKWADTEVPMLMLQGELDPATHYDNAVILKEHFNGTHQTFVSFPTAAHNVTSGTPISQDSEVVSCGLQLFIAFLKNPESELDLSCVDQVLPNDFEGSEELAQEIFGTDHLWDNLESGSTKKVMRFTFAQEHNQTLKELRIRMRRALPAIRTQIKKDVPEFDPMLHDFMATQQIEFR